MLPHPPFHSRRCRLFIGLDADVHEAEFVLLESFDAFLGRRDRWGRQPAQVISFRDAMNGVAVEVRQELARRKGEVVEGGYRAATRLTIGPRPDAL
jgi:hypothetical protein